MSQASVERLVFTPVNVVRRSLVILAGALLVALAAQVAIPLPVTPVPVTLQVLAVLVVGGLLGPRAGAASMVLYLALGVAGLPVFAPGGAPGFARLLGPTGGYLLAYPLAAALAGQLCRSGESWRRMLLGLFLATSAIHLGGIAQLAVLSGDLIWAIGAGSLPFLPFDLVKLVAAALILRRLGPTFRARL
ncbi:Biotin transporter BioY [bacterium HR33]|nr:Biotin transporter BioY [bacterium HR33]